MTCAALMSDLLGGCLLGKVSDLYQEGHKKVGESQECVGQPSLKVQVEEVSVLKGLQM